MRAIPRVLIAAAGFLVAGPAVAQSTLERPPNVSGAWTGPAGTLHFHFVHRFNHSGAPRRHVSNSPTFLLAAGLPARTLVGVHYATSSDVAPNVPNEWEFFGRLAALAQEAGAPADVGVQGGYNLAAESFDGELTLARRLGPVRVIGVARYFSNGYFADESRVAVGGGGSLRLGRHLALSGDAVSLLDRGDGEEVAWSAGISVAIPYTPHTLSLHAGNTSTGTLQGASRGRDRVSYGFEFTVPLTLGRYFGDRPSPPVAAAPPAGGAAEKAQAGAVVQAALRGFAFLPNRIEVEAGTTVRWTNEDDVVHTVTAQDGSWNSGDIAPGGIWERTFDRPGTYAFTCTPHPFMTGVVVVR